VEDVPADKVWAAHGAKQGAQVIKEGDALNLNGIVAGVIAAVLGA